MKKVMLVAALAALSTGYVAIAQQAKQAAPATRVQRQVDPAKVAEMRVKRLQTDVPDLNADQQKKAYEVYLKTEQQRPEYRTDRSKMEQAYEQEKTELMTLLTPAQAEQYKALEAKRQADRKAAMDARMQNRGDLKAAPATK